MRNLSTEDRIRLIQGNIQLYMTLAVVSLLIFIAACWELNKTINSNLQHLEEIEKENLEADTSR